LLVIPAKAEALYNSEAGQPSDFGYELDGAPGVKEPDLGRRTERAEIHGAENMRWRHPGILRRWPWAPAGK
jgi:hypothetical protein